MYKCLADFTISTLASEWGSDRGDVRRRSQAKTCQWRAGWQFSYSCGRQISRCHGASLTILQECSRADLSAQTKLSSGCTLAEGSLKFQAPSIYQRQIMGGGTCATPPDLHPHQGLPPRWLQQGIHLLSPAHDVDICMACCSHCTLSARCAAGNVPIMKVLSSHQADITRTTQTCSQARLGVILPGVYRYPP